MRAGAVVMAGLVATVGGLAVARAAPNPTFDADAAGVLVVVTTPTVAADPRPRALAAELVAQGFESFVAADMVAPPPDAAARLDAGRDALRAAEADREAGRFERAARAADAALRAYTSAASSTRHLADLVDALYERGTSALALGDAATAETAFLEALALAPRRAPDATRYGEPARRLFADVRRAARQQRFAQLTIEVPGLPGAEVGVDFGGARPAPYETRLSEGRHFVEVTAPGRSPLVAQIEVRAGRRTRLALRPALAGDVTARAEARRAFDPDLPASVAALVSSAGLRYALAAALEVDRSTLQLLDGRSGVAVGAPIVVSARLTPTELDAAVQQVVQRIAAHDGDALARDDDTGWYATWWGITLIGVVVAGAAAGTAVAVTRGGEIEYRFEP